MSETVTVNNVYMNTDITSDNGTADIVVDEISFIKIARQQAINARDIIAIKFQKDSSAVVCSGYAVELLGEFSKRVSEQKADDINVVDVRYTPVPGVDTFESRKETTLRQFLGS